MSVGKKYPGILAALLAALSSCPALCAQVQINGIDWQVSRAEGEKTLPFEPVPELKLQLYRNYPNKLRAVVKVLNSSTKPVEGLVLRYALSLHVVKVSDPADPGFWAVPFRVDEVRISRIRPGASYDARLVHVVFNELLKKLRNTGFWADALKLQVMLDPRTGDEPDRIMKEAVIEIKRP